MSDCFRIGNNRSFFFLQFNGWFGNIFLFHYGSRHFIPGCTSFRLKAVKQYEGINFLPYPFFQRNKPYVKNKALQVRNGGNDTSNRIIDAAIQQVVIRSGFYLDCQDTQPAHVFFNGKFQFTFNIREPANANLSYSNYGIDKDEVDEFEINGSVGYYQKSGDNKAMLQWINLAQQLANHPTDDSIYEQICELVDIDEYCNFMAAGCYIGCSDWLTNCNNVKGFRSRADGGKFHLVLMDQDQGFEFTDMLSRLPSHLNDSRFSTGRNFIIDPFLNMLKYEPFRRRFIDAFCLVAGSIFEPERCRAIITEMASTTETALSWEGRSPWGSANNLINKITSNSQRSARINSLVNYLQLEQPYSINLSSNIPEATLLVNDQEVPTGRFSGTLFPPATITAKAPAGYHFTGWKTNGDPVTKRCIFDLNSQWIYYDQGSLDGMDWKASSYSISGWKSAKGPFGYGNVGIEAGTGDYTTTLDYGDNSNNKRPTYYFRRNFYITEKIDETVDVYSLTYYVDDGCVIYVNGQELTRYHMPEGTPTYATYSTTYEGSQAYSATVIIPPSMLKSGSNIITVEVHNTSATSSDIYWGAILNYGSYSVASEEQVLPLEQMIEQDIHEVTAQFQRLEDKELQNDWIELYNTTDFTLNAAGLYLSDKVNNPYKYQVPSSSALDINTIIPPHGHLVLWADKLDPYTQLHTPFKLSNQDGEAIVLNSSEEFVAANPDFFAAHPELRTFTDIITYNTHAGDQSVGRYPDGADTFYLMQRPTIGNTNSLRTYDLVMSTDQDVHTGIGQPAEPAGDEMAAISGYYTISGLYLGNDRCVLRPGIYIVRLTTGEGKKMIIK